MEMRWIVVPICFVLLLIWIFQLEKWFAPSLSTLFAILSFAVFMGCLIFFAMKAYKKWLPEEMGCPNCGTLIKRDSEGVGTMFHYDCDSCQIRWGTNMNHEEST